MTRPLRLAINGYGRIGRCVLRALHESPHRDAFEVVAINEPAADLPTMAYLTQFDSTHGAFRGKIEQAGKDLVVDGRHIAVIHASDPLTAGWEQVDADLLLECSGRFSSREQLQLFLEAGFKRVLVSQPGNSALDVDYTVVHGINDNGLTGKERIVSNASCTTNAVVPVLDALHKDFGIRHAFLTTLHSVMNDQPLLDGYHHVDLRRTRSALQSLIPVETGLAQGVERLLPQLAGKVQAKAVRVPILNVSAIDLMVQLGRDVQVDELNAALRALSARLPGIIAYSSHHHASVDFNHDPHSAIIDGSQTRSNGDGFANLFIWFDNEWGFANRMLDVACTWSRRFADDARADIAGV
ncbi:type I glyceraldehyde-3-phosphate dehydrogenase [Allopusillimonas ginsengisoli]|uniref:type I glyceraldehyde-3-phosphate dehydrogenase n=1 Tax=Allopusillimonas ginsengisoli TaxID=453575 RepID=UPI0039C283EA